MLYELGDLSTDEIARAACVDDALARVARRGWPAPGRIVERDVGGQRRWVHAERLAEYERLADDPLPVLRAG